jgi:isopentenyldiphosphate isomerase
MINGPDEIFDVVDAENNVIGRASRQEVHAKGLMHRSVHILVFNSRGELFLQKRSMDKDENPGFWDTSAAGHVDSGEEYSRCAERERNEELGIGDTTLEEIMRLPAQKDTLWEHVRVYKCVTDSNIIINEQEISEGHFWTLSDLTESLKSNPELFTSTFHLIYNRYIINNGS